MFLSWTTNKVTRAVEQEIGLEHKVLLYRTCAVAAREDAKSGDALVNLDPKLSDGYEYNEKLSKADLLLYLKSSAIDYLRCEVVNAGKLPVLKVQIALSGQYAHHRPFRIVTSALPALSADPLAADSRAAIWFVDNSNLPITLYSPQAVKYVTVEGKSNDDDTLEPRLNDRWIVKSNKDVQEILDQRNMKDF